MNLEYFVSTLENMNPSEELLIKMGFSGLHLDVLRKNFVLPRKRNVDDLGEDLIKRLTEEYDMKYLIFSDYSFMEELRYENGMTLFCISSYSVLAYKSFNTEVIEYDREETSILDYAAKNGECFLTSLLYFLELQSLRFQGLVDMDDEVINRKYFDLCMGAAGGIKYSGFFKKIIY